MSLPEFIEFEKIPRLNRQCVITEKIDGTNASIFIPEPDAPPLVTSYGMTMPFLVGSRNRWIYPESDNAGFAKWALNHREELLQLGPGHHFGEWWGAGIQRRYGLTEKRFSLFNVGRWTREQTSEADKQQTVPSCCHVVPIVKFGIFSSELVREAIETLARGGSYAAPGFMKPDGVVIYHEASRSLFKVTIEKDEAPKSAA